MADKRMFTKKITDSDAFIEMSSAAQALYFHLNQGADDDGFNNQVQMAMWKAHASIDDLKVLMAKNYIIRFESGVIVIKHWRMHNTLRKDRYTPTNFQDELEQLGVKDNGSYTRLPNGCQVVAERLPQYSIGKDSIDQFSLDKDSVVEDSVVDDTTLPDDYDELKCIKGIGKGVVYLSDRQSDSLLDEMDIRSYDWYIERLADFIIDKKAHVKNHYEMILKWYKEDSEVTV